MNKNRGGIGVIYLYDILSLVFLITPSLVYNNYYAQSFAPPHPSHPKHRIYTNNCFASFETETENASSTRTSLADLYECLGIFSPAVPTLSPTDNLPSKEQEPLFYLSKGIPSCPEKNDERGVLLTQNVERDSILICIPLSSCLCDDSPPEWFYAENSDEEEDDVANGMDLTNDTDNEEQENIMDSLIMDQTNRHLHNPSQWATRLAASLLDLQDMCSNHPIHKDSYDDNNNREFFDQRRVPGLSQWLSMGPNPSSLRASLPVHWSDEALSNARCCALELAVDSLYFSRAEAVDALLDGLRRRNKKKRTKNQEKKRIKEEEEDEEDEGIMAARCHWALDFVQTRVCRVDRCNGLHPHMRLLAPIFDFINHGCSTTKGRQRANASFKLEQFPDHVIPKHKKRKIEKEDCDSNVFLVVRAIRDMEKGEEVLIDYGESAHPEWKCLSSYGFVPDFNDDDNDDDLDSVAEVFMDGVRYEVGKSTVPIDMVMAASTSLASENGEYDVPQLDKNADSGEKNMDGENINDALTAAVALRIAKRVSDVAYDLLLENTNNNNSNAYQNMNIEDEKEEDSESAAEIHAFSLAASLRHSQHRVLLSCATGLRDYAAQSMGLD